jgi:hypothetical protein
MVATSISTYPVKQTSSPMANFERSRRIHQRTRIVDVDHHDFYISSANDDDRSFDNDNNVDDGAAIDHKYRSINECDDIAVSGGDHNDERVSLRPRYDDHDPVNDPTGPRPEIASL